MASMNLSTLIPELLQRIAFFLATDSLLAAPNLVSLLCTCRTIHAKLNVDAAPYLYDRIFRAKFDVEAPRRRLGEDVIESSNLAKELRIRYLAMNRLRRGEIDGEFVLADLWLAYLMLLESDGKNERQLMYRARVKQFALSYMLEHVRVTDANNWPLETDGLSLAVWIYWLVYDPQEIYQDQNAYQELLTILQPFIVASFKYTTFLIPDTHYGVPFTGSPTSNPPRCKPTVHGTYPIYRPPLSPTHPNITHFSTPITIAPPPLATAAMLIAFTTRQIHRFLAHPNAPRRAELGAEVLEAMTVEDVEEFNEGAVTRLVRRCEEGSVEGGYYGSCSFTGEEDTPPPAMTSGGMVVSIFASSGSASVRDRVSSLQHEHDWLRLTKCYNPWLEAKIKTRIYTPGMLDGLWAGRWFIYDDAQFSYLLNTPDMPDTLGEAFPTVYQRPLYMRLREHHCLPTRRGSGFGYASGCGGDEFSEEDGGVGLPVSYGQFAYDSEAEALAEGFFPPEVKMVEHDGELTIYDPSTDEHLYYETYTPGKPNSHMRAGGCERCRPDPSRTIPPARMREYEKLVQREMEVDDEGEVWEDSVNDGCVTDIVITGETDFVHSRPWGFFKFIGRVRDLDGLIVLLRIPVHPTSMGVGTYIFRGYIHHNQNFVGRWRDVLDTTTYAVAEGAFSLCKRAE